MLRGVFSDPLGAVSREAHPKGVQSCTTPHHPYFSCCVFYFLGWPRNFSAERCGTSSKFLPFFFDVLSRFDRILSMLSRKDSELLLRFRCFVVFVTFWPQNIFRERGSGGTYFYLRPERFLSGRKKLVRSRKKGPAQLATSRPLFFCFLLSFPFFLFIVPFLG